MLYLEEFYFYQLLKKGFVFDYDLAPELPLTFAYSAAANVSTYPEGKRLKGPIRKFLEGDNRCFRFSV